MKAGFWKGRRVFVTGHTGFMGGWLCECLLQAGADVMGYALPAPTTPSLFEINGLADRVPTAIADIRDGDRLASALQAAGADVVFHLAAQPLVRQAHAEPVETFSTNLMGTVNLLEALRGAETVSAAVIITTDKVYDNRETPWGYRETDPLGGHEPYGASKACAEFAVESYARSYFTGPTAPAIATVRAGNIIGGGDWAADRIVPDAVRSFEKGRPLALRHPDAIRPWQHVLEPVSGMMALASTLAKETEHWSGAWNFGPDEDDTHTVAWLADQLCAAWGDGAAWVQEADTGPYEAKLLNLASAKAKASINWRPYWRAEIAVAKTAEWYRAYGAGAEMTALTVEQIESYEKDKDSDQNCRSQDKSQGRAVA